MKQTMDALRNTLREWSLTASPCSKVVGNSDVWGPIRLSEDEWVHSNHPAADARLNSIWEWHPHQHKSDYRSVHDADNEEYDERKHLRAALRSVVSNSTFSSRASIDTPSSRCSSPNLRPYHAFPSTFDEEEGKVGCVDDFESDHDSPTQLVTMQPTSDRVEEDKGVLLLPPNKSVGLFSPLQPSHACVAAVTAAAAADQGNSPEWAGVAAAKPDSTSETATLCVGNAASISVSPSELSTTLPQTCSAADPTVTSATETAGSCFAISNAKRPPCPPCEMVRMPHTSLPISVTSSNSSCVHYSRYVDGDDVGNDNSASGSSSRLHLSHGSTLLESSPVHDTTSTTQDHRGSRNNSNHRINSFRNPSRHLVLRPKVFADNAQEDITMSDVSLNALHYDAETLDNDVSSAEQKDFSSTTQGLTITMAFAWVATNFSRTRPNQHCCCSNDSNNKKDGVSLNMTGGVVPTTTTATATEKSTKASTNTIATITTATKAITPSHHSSPNAIRPQVSLLQCYAPLTLDDHAAAHVLPRPVEPATTATMLTTASATPLTVEDDNNDTPTAAAAASSTTRHPLLIPQPHCSARDMNGRTVLLRTHRHYSVVSNTQTPLQVSSAAHTPLEASAYVPNVMTGIGLSSVPQPYGAYPYQWMVATDLMGSSGGQLSSESGGSSSSTFLLHRPPSSVLISSLS